MKRKLVGLALFVAAAAMPATLSRAADTDPPLPVVRDVGCTAQCAGDVTDAVAIKRPSPNYPRTFINGDYGGYVEGIVEMELMVGPDGRVSDLMVTHLVGPQKFADVSKDAAKDWVFKPATLNGQPTDFDQKLNFVFIAVNGPEIARNEIIVAYRDAFSLAKNGKTDEAKARLTAALAKPALNFYERAYLGNLLAIIAMGERDYLKARQLIELPTYLAMSNKLAAPDVPALLRTRLLADLGVGDLSDATDMLTRLRALPHFDAQDPAIQLVADLKTKIDAAESFGVDAAIPAADQGDAFTIGLYRHVFAIHNITGSLDNVIISCGKHTVESGITDKAEWHVPKDWSGCHAIIRGSAGTSFQLVEYAG